MSKLVFKTKQRFQNNEQKIMQLWGNHNNKHDVSIKQSRFFSELPILKKIGSVFTI